MRQRVLAVAAALVVVVGLVALAVVGSGGDGPRPLPIGAAGLGAAPEAAPMVADAAMRVAPTEHRVEGELAELDGEEHAWSVGREADQDRIAALAEVLGIDGDVEATEDGWRVADGETSLDVSRQPGLPWSSSPVYEEVHGPDTAVSSEPTAPDEARPAPDDGQYDCPMPDCPPGTACIQACAEPVAPAPEGEPESERPAGLPNELEAEAIGRDVLARAGVSLADAEVRTHDLFSSWLVSAQPAVGGLPTVGMEWAVAIGPDGVVEHANGWLADPTEGDAYPLVGTTAALDRLRADQGGGFGGPEPDCVDCPEEEPRVVTITGVRLGLQLVHAYDAAEAWLVPTYLFATDEGTEEGIGELPVLALGDEHIARPPAEELPEGCEMVGGDAVVCDDKGQVTTE